MGNFIINILIAINTAIFIPTLFQRNLANLLFSYFAKSNLAISNGEYYRLVTSMFLHADLTHLAVNMFSLWNVGPLVVNFFGLNGFLAIYFLSGIGGSFTSYLFSQSNSVGASGAIFGLVGALISVAIMTNNNQFFSSLMLVVVLNFAISINPSSNIDNFGHLGGLISGLVIGFILYSFFPRPLIGRFYN
jgi:rhomboid protease GluP